MLYPHLVRVGGEGEGIRDGLGQERRISVPQGISQWREMGMRSGGCGGAAAGRGERFVPLLSVGHTEERTGGGPMGLRPSATFLCGNAAPRRPLSAHGRALRRPGVALRERA